MRGGRYVYDVIKSSQCSQKCFNCCVHYCCSHLFCFFTILLNGGDMKELKEEMQGVSTAYWAALNREPEELAEILKQRLKLKPDLKVGITWLKCSDSDKSYHIITKNYLLRLFKLLKPIKDKVKFVQLSSPGLKKMMKEVAKELEYVQEEIKEEKQKMQELIDEIVCEEIKELDDYLEIKAVNDDYEVVVKDFSFNLLGEEKIYVKLYKG